MLYLLLMNRGYTTIFFDWSGVVADDSGDDFINQLLRGVGADDDQIEVIIETYFENFLLGQLSEIEFWERLKTNYGFNITNPTSGSFKIWRGLVANKDIIALSSEAKAKGLRTAVLTNIIEPVYDIIKQSGGYDFFDEVIASCKVGLIKPQREIFQLALDRLQTIAQQSIFIDDKQVNLDTASAMGLKTILAQNPNQIIRDVRNCW